MMEMALRQNPHPVETAQGLIDQQRFETRFNHLMEKLLDFAAKYNAGRSIDVKKVKEINKAWRDLEHSDAWFRPDKSR